MSQNVEPKLLAKINDQEGRDGIDLSLKSIGDRVRFETRNSVNLRRQTMAGTYSRIFSRVNVRRLCNHGRLVARGHAR